MWCVTNKRDEKPIIRHRVTERVQMCRVFATPTSCNSVQTDGLTKMKSWMTCFSPGTFGRNDSQGFIYILLLFGRINKYGQRWKVESVNERWQFWLQQTRLVAFRHCPRYDICLLLSVECHTSTSFWRYRSIRRSIRFRVGRQV